MTQSVPPSMQAQGSETVLHVSSLADYRPMVLTGPAYSPAKAGVNSSTESLDGEAG